MRRHFGTIAGVLFVAILAAGVCRAEEAVVEDSPEAGFDAAEETVPDEAAEAMDVESEAYRRARYDVIVDRSPFGEDPLVDETKKQEEAAVKALEKDYRLCFLLESQSGEVRAGFQNKKATAGDPKSVILMVGESHGPMKLLDIDLENSSARLQYQGREVTFELTKAPVAAAQASAARPTAPPSRASSSSSASSQTQRRFGGGFRRTTPPASEPEETSSPQVSDDEAEQRRQEVRAALQEYQMEVLRQGQPPLPVDLTPEQDDQLVAEGVLPPIPD